MVLKTINVYNYEGDDKIISVCCLLFIMCINSEMYLRMPVIDMVFVWHCLHAVIRFNSYCFMTCDAVICRSPVQDRTLFLCHPVYMSTVNITSATLMLACM